LPAKEPESLGEALERLAADSELGVRLEQAQVWEQWERVVGERAAAHCRPVRIKEGVLTLAVDGAPWMHRLSYYKERIVARVNALFSKPMVTEAYLRLADEEDES
jgi:predicted nucleic acid-binding Zn ribbon protein